MSGVRIPPPLPLPTAKTISTAIPRLQKPKNSEGFRTKPCVGTQRFRRRFALSGSIFSRPCDYANPTQGFRALISFIFLDRHLVSVRSELPLRVRTRDPTHSKTLQHERWAQVFMGAATGLSGSGEQFGVSCPSGSTRDRQLGRIGYLATSAPPLHGVSLAIFYPRRGPGSLRKGPRS